MKIEYRAAMVLFGAFMIGVALLLPPTQRFVTPGLAMADVDNILHEEVRAYEVNYGKIMPPIELKAFSEVKNDYSKDTHSNINGFYQAKTEYSEAILVTSNTTPMSELEARGLAIHELCHHYIASICGYGTDRPKLARGFEEAFCSGYQALKTNDFSKHIDPVYDQLYGYPLELFECGFKTCDLQRCYDMYVGENGTN